ncbi:MAG TPA: glycoside hydrolase family 36 protein [Bacilli bacterium]
MSSNIIVDQEVSNATAQSVPAFPWVRFDANKFIYEEAFINGNLNAVHLSAMGRCMSRERIFFTNWWKDASPGSPWPMKNHLPSFEIEADGQLLHDGWEWVSHQEINHEPGGKELLVTLDNLWKPVRVIIHTKLDGTSFISRWLEIINKGSRPLSLSRVYPWAGIITWANDGLTLKSNSMTGFLNPFKLGRFYKGMWGMEGEFGWETLPEGSLCIEQLKERKHNPPMYMVRNEVNGELFVLHFGWSGNLKIEFTTELEPALPHVECKAYLYGKVGLAGPAPLKVLQAGESAVTPAVHFSMLYGGLDEAVQATHDHLRASVIPKQPSDRQHLVEYNHTGYTMNAQISRELLDDEVDMAAGVGCELFMLDAGWFGDKDKNWYECVGDWTENPLLEGKLHEVFDRARAKGMKCGIWLEIERAAEQSDFAKLHPDWFVTRGDTKLQMLDLSRSVVEDYVYETLEAIISGYNIDCFRLDHNDELYIGGQSINGEYRETTLWRYFEGLYRVFERLQARFPGLLLENCSGGGGRLDLGIMSKFHWTQISDNWHAVDQLRILNGLTLALPPEQCMPLIGAIRMTPADADFMVRAGLFGHFCISGVFPMVEKANESSLQSWKHAVDLYKKEMRPILDSCKVFHHTPIQNFRQPGNWVVLEYAAPDFFKSIVGIFRLGESESEVYQCTPKGIDISKKYNVYLDNLGQSFETSGYELSSRGISIRIPGPVMSELIIINEIA